jgi:hypothetical protein
MYKKVMVPILGKFAQEEGFLIEEDVPVKNGDIEAKVSFYITRMAIISYFHNFLIKADTIEEVISDYIERHQPRIKNIFLTAIEKLSTPYRGSSSTLQNISDFRLLVYVGTGAGYCGFSGFELPLWIGIGEMAVKNHINWNGLVAHVLSHELYHVAADIHDEQGKQTKSLQKRRNRLEVAIKRNRIQIKRGIEAYLKVFEKSNSKQPRMKIRDIVASGYASRTSSDDFVYGLTHVETRQNIEFIELRELQIFLHKFFGEWPGSFCNRINDSALCVIALTIQDKEFINGATNIDKFLVSDSHQNFQYIKEHLEYIEYNAGSKKDFFLHLMKLLQFITCFCYMPYLSVAYGVLGEDIKPVKKIHIIRRLRRRYERKRPNQSNEVINQFKDTVNEYCEPDVASGFLRFFESYLDAVKTMSIYIDPCNPDIIKEIHDRNCRKKASQTFKILNREFNLLLSEFKKYK